LVAVNTGLLELGGAMGYMCAYKLQTD